MGDLMSDTIFTKELMGLTAMTTGGYPLGIIEDVVIETTTGEMKYLLVKMRTAAKAGQKVDSKGRAVIAFNNLKIVGENVMII